MEDQAQRPDFVRSLERGLAGVSVRASRGSTATLRRTFLPQLQTAAAAVESDLRTPR